MEQNIYIKMQFSPEIAKIVGTDAAIIYSNIEYWVEKNKANNKNNYDGHYWTYNSISAFNKMFNYLTEKQIRTCLKKLEDVGFIKTGNYNQSSYDRTKWYTCNRPNGQIDLTKRSNGTDQTVTAIPNNKPNNKPNNLNKIAGKQHIVKTETSKDVHFEEIKKLYYNYLKQHQIPIMNHNVLRSKIKEMYELYDYNWCYNYLNFMINQYANIDDKYKPMINNATDLYTKSKSIQNLMNKIVKEDEIY